MAVHWPVNAAHSCRFCSRPHMSRCAGNGESLVSNCWWPQSRNLRCPLRSLVFADLTPGNRCLPGTGSPSDKLQCPSRAHVSGPPAEPFTKDNRVTAGSLPLGTELSARADVQMSGLDAIDLHDRDPGHARAGTVGEVWQTPCCAACVCALRLKWQVVGAKVCNVSGGRKLMRGDTGTLASVFPHQTLPPGRYPLNSAG